MVNGMASVIVAEDAKEPYLRITLEDGREVEMSTNLAEMIGGAAAGLRQRTEEREDERS